MTTALFLAFAIAAVASYFSLLRNYFLLSLGASVAWIALWAAVKAYPPVGVAAGSSYQNIMMMACIVMAVVFPLVSLGRQVTRQRDQSGNFSTRSTGFRFRKLFGGSEEEEEEKDRRSRMGMEDRNVEYRRQVRSALRREKRR